VVAALGAGDAALAQHEAADMRALGVLLCGQEIRPVVGELGLAAYSFFGMRPAR